MSGLKSARNWFLAMLLVVSILSLTMAATAPSATQQLKAFFQATIRQGPDAGLVAYGVLTLQVDPRNGNFTGTLTPAVSLETGLPFPTVLFTQKGGSFTPIPDGPTEIEVRGTMHGHAINLIMLNVVGAGQDIVGVGTMENTLKEWLQGKGPGVVAGAAVGPAPGDSGDWANPCCSSH
jgi:hypothetical protein